VDGLGSTRGLTDGAGNVTDTYSYDAFGNLVASAGGTANNYLFAGEQFDPNLGDYYLRQRYYNPGVGRFTRRDTYEGTLEDPITLHKYLYGNANPVTYTDPTGLFSAGEAQAAADIANTLAGIQWESGGHLIAATLNDGDYEPDDMLRSMAGGLLLTTTLSLLPFMIKGWRLTRNKKLSLIEPNQELTKVLSRTQYGSRSGLDCSEVAEDLLELAGNKGKIIRVQDDPPMGSMRLIIDENQLTGGWYYHEVFTDGQHVFDPGLKTPLPINTWKKLMKSLNPGAKTIEMPSDSMNRQRLRDKLNRQFGC
jgi:RHS repeat-associated protein